ncbi:MAG: DNA repair protein RecN [Clostridiales bacterium]|nr:DNA repair protein RecN [Clostridiales bacterium]
MLSRLYIANIAVIEKAEIEFDSGLNVLTGETGAGKSIVIDSLNAVLGERVSREIVRSGSPRAEVTALFTGLAGSTAAMLEAKGYPPDEEGALLIQRMITAEGKSACRINGRPVTVAVLREIGRELVNIHGQHENQALLDPERHVGYLDRLGGIEAKRNAYQEAYHRFCAIRTELGKSDMDEREKARRMDLLHYQVEEIDEAGLQMGEEEELLEQRNLYRNAAKIAEAVAAARQALSGDEESDGALARLSAAVDAISEAGRYVSEMEQLEKRAQSLLYELEECAGELRDFGSSLEFDPDELDRIETRLETIRRLTVKYGPGIEEILRFGAAAAAELEEIELSDEHLAHLREELTVAADAAKKAASVLTAARRAAAKRFTADVGKQLTFLDMPDVRLEVAVEPAELSVSGADQVEFRISANPGEPVRAISRIASGGELSRIMLALKSVLAGADDIDTLIFDEIDTGISGRAARKVGIKLRQIGGERQVLCVTHLAQIAALAHRHLLIRKEVREGRTFTGVTPLEGEEREQELARIIGGTATDANLLAAREMLRENLSPLSGDGSL